MKKFLITLTVIALTATVMIGSRSKVLTESHTSTVVPSTPSNSHEQSASPLAQSSLPTGNWAAACAPSKKIGKVVDLFKVSSDAARGVMATEVWLENRSARRVAGVRVGWKMYNVSAPTKVLSNGQTAEFIEVDLNAGEKKTVKYDLVSFAEIGRPLVRDGMLDGTYRIELWVSDVRYSSEPTFVKAVSRVVTTAEEGCQNQECYWDNPSQCERCKTVQGSTCAWSTCSMCTNGRCSGEID